MHCLWPKQRENNSAKSSVALKPRIFSPANLSPSMVPVCTVGVNVKVIIFNWQGTLAGLVNALLG